jgi:hypothetical protein
VPEVLEGVALHILLKVLEDQEHLVKVMLGERVVILVAHTLALEAVVQALLG